MSTQLNRIDDDDIGWSIDFEQKSLSKASPDDYGRRWCSFFALAAYSHQQEKQDTEVRAHFLEAARNGVTAYERASKPTPGEPPNQIRTPWDFGLMLGVVCGFGSAEELQQAGNIERWKWFYPEDEFYLLQADSLEQLQRYLADRFDREAAARVVIRCQAENADRSAVRFDGQLVQTLLAIEAGDAAAANAAVNTMVKEHEHRAKRGLLKLATDGLVAVIPLGLVRLARLRGIDLTISSPYVPVELLE